MHIEINQDASGSILDIKFGGKGRLHLVLVPAHPPFKDPRVTWEVGAASPEDIFICLGTHTDAEAKPVIARQVYPNVVEIVAYRYLPISVEQKDLLSYRAGTYDALSTYYLIRDFNRGGVEAIHNKLALEQERLIRFHNICDYVQRSTDLMLDLASGLDRVDSIIAADLDAMIAGVLLKNRFNAPLFFDAHEFWPEASDFSEPEIAFWTDVERTLVKHADGRFSASEPAAQYFSQIYNVPFTLLPNCEPKSSALSLPPRAPRDPSAPCTFLLQGGLSRTRGIHLLIKAWRHVKSDSVLIFRGPIMDPPYMDEAMALAGDMLGTRIIFAPSVTEEELVRTAAESDVGLIPYEPVSINNKYCCPNKLSQYMAAGLPILANDLPYVKQVIEKGECGISLDFNDEHALAQAIDALANDPERLKTMGENARKHFLSEFNWNNQSKAFYDQIDALTAVPSAPWEQSYNHNIQQSLQKPQEQLALLKKWNNLVEIVPNIPQTKSLAVQEADFYDWKSREPVECVNLGDGTFLADFCLPVETDITHVFLEFDSEYDIPDTVHVEAFNDGGTRGSRSLEGNNQPTALLPLVGNSAYHIRVTLKVDIERTGRVVINHREFIGYGLVRTKTPPMAGRMELKTEPPTLPEIPHPRHQPQHLPELSVKQIVWLTVGVPKRLARRIAREILQVVKLR